MRATRQIGASSPQAIIGGYEEQAEHCGDDVDDPAGNTHEARVVAARPWCLQLPHVVHVDHNRTGLATGPSTRQSWLGTTDCPQLRAVAVGLAPKTDSGLVGFGDLLPDCCQAR